MAKFKTPILHLHMGRLIKEQYIFMWYKNKLAEDSSQKVNKTIILGKDNVLLKLFC